MPTEQLKRIESFDNEKDHHIEISFDIEEVASLLYTLRDRFSSIECEQETLKRKIPANRFFGVEEEETFKRRKIGTEDNNDEEKELVRHDVDDEDYLEELPEEDEDWFDSRCYSLNPTSAPGPKIPRKKAPSGSACEKHKRWKKRCPEDCPMRKKNRKLKDGLFSEVAELGDSFEEEEVRTRRQRNMDVESPDTPRRGRRASNGTVACERHTIAHMRCPPHCPERRPSSRRATTKDSFGNDCDLEDYDQANLSPSSNIEDFSPKSCDSDSIEDDDDFQVETTFLVNLNQMVTEIPKSPRIQLRALTAKDSKQDKKKAPRKGPRKYLPQACERHKLLHAKCPANCPDRIKRDSEKHPIDFFHPTVTN